MSSKQGKEAMSFSINQTSFDNDRSYMQELKLNFEREQVQQNGTGYHSELSSPPGKEKKPSSKVRFDTANQAMTSYIFKGASKGKNP
mmetsp:Transcript_14712/g.10615  ORF Transcript_14712/g.10615 Transcript_14712/m.10615 type:complete len:87 (+) Transcript_14712:129-389(+)